MHFQLTFDNISTEQKDILIAQLYEFCDGFEEHDNSLEAIVSEEKFNEELKRLFAEQGLQPVVDEIPEQNWNELWESNFEPVVTDDFVAIRADFHQPISGVLHEIIITPKMSFGTGHHATTYLMMKQMQNIDFSGRSVFDFGTGTGILAILAKKLGAEKIIATDIDSWSIENASENFHRNKIRNIKLIRSHEAKQDQTFDVILANINKNVLLNTIPQLTEQLNENGVLLLSGLLEEDENEIQDLCTKCGLNREAKASKMNWIVLKYSKL